MAMVVSPSLAGAPGCFTFDDVAIKSSTLGVLSSFLKASILRRQVTSTHSRRMNAWKVKAMADTTLSAELADKPYAGSLERTLPNQYKITREDDLFDWNAQWYPAAVAADIDKRVPKPVTILGRDLVIWWDRNGEAWQVFDDKCPHRLAPLSEGRINEQGHLQCSYHGWSFAPRSGQCTLIPQAPADGVPVWESKRACAAVYPSVEQEGLIWFWPDTKLELKDIIKITKPPSIPALADPTFKDELGSRDLPYSYEQLIENLMDPSHVPFAHHGLQLRSMRHSIFISYLGNRTAGLF